MYFKQATPPLLLLLAHLCVIDSDWLVDEGEEETYKVNVQQHSEYVEQYYWDSWNNQTAHQIRSN